MIKLDDKYLFTNTAACTIMASYTPSNMLTITNCAEISLTTGNVRLLTENVNDAAKQFWKAVEYMYPGVIKS